MLIPLIQYRHQHSYSRSVFLFSVLISFSPFFSLQRRRNNSLALKRLPRAGVRWRRMASRLASYKRLRCLSSPTSGALPRRTTRTKWSRRTCCAPAIQELVNETPARVTAADRWSMNGRTSVWYSSGWCRGETDVPERISLACTQESHGFWLGLDKILPTAATAWIDGVEERWKLERNELETCLQSTVE